MKRVLLTGAGGFIGAHTFAHIMHNTDWFLVCTDSFRHKGKADRIAEMIASHPEWRTRFLMITHDLTAPFSPQTRELIGPIDYIINMASQSHVDRSLWDPVNFVENNVSLVLNMLEFARVVEPEAFIQISTDEVYGPCPEGHLFEEWSTILPSNPYSASKAAQESIAISYWRSYGVPLIITNTMNNFGEMQDVEKFIPLLIKNVNKGDQVSIHGSIGNVGSRFYLHARNHADALIFLLKREPPSVYSAGDHIRPDRYNVVGEVEMDNLDLALRIARILDKDLNYVLEDFHMTRPGHDRRYALDGRKLASLGWKPPVDFQESLEHTVAWTIDHPEWMLPD